MFAITGPDRATESMRSELVPVIADSEAANLWREGFDQDDRVIAFFQREFA